MTGYIRTSGVVDIGYTYIKENHLFKDDYLYISYKEKLKFESVIKEKKEIEKIQKNIFEKWGR